MGDLFDLIDEGKRRRLRQRGWVEAGHSALGRPLWRDPRTGALQEEAEVFAWLDRAEVLEQDGGD